MEIPLAVVIVVAVLAVLNVIVFLMYGADKKKAVNKAWRTPEPSSIPHSAFT